MDHIRCPGDDPWPKEVPYIFDPNYDHVFDNEQWSTYYNRRGWTFIELKGFDVQRPSQNPEHTAPRVASLLQAWLYFGLIYAITELPVDTQKYVRITSEGRQVVSTAHLPRHLELWSELIEKKSEEQKSRHSEELDRLVKVVQVLLGQFLNSKNCVLPSEVCFSIDILWTTLLSFKKGIYPDSAIPRLRPFGDTHRKIVDHLHQKGWCKFDAMRVCQTFFSLTLYYMGACEFRKTSRDHSNCNDKCVVLQQQQVNKSYKQRHINSQCNCANDRPGIGPSQINSRKGFYSGAFLC
jgi:hypothetical protein